VNIIGKGQDIWSPAGIGTAYLSDVSQMHCRSDNTIHKVPTYSAMDFELEVTLTGKE